MDDRRVGRIFREVRVRHAWRQKDVSDAASVSPGVVSLIERGRPEQVSLRKIRAVGAILNITASIDAWWRSGEVDRLLDRGHAALVDHVVTELHERGWVTRVEVTFNHFGERGSADIVSWHPEERILLIVEVKTRIGDVRATASAFERTVRVLPALLAAEKGWEPVDVGRLRVLADTHANRDVVRDHAANFDSIWRDRTAEVRRRIGKPRGGGTSARRGLGGIWFLAYDRIGEPGVRANARQVGRVRTARSTTARSTTARPAGPGTAQRAGHEQ